MDEGFIGHEQEGRGDASDDELQAPARTKPSKSKKTKTMETIERPSIKKTNKRKSLEEIPPVEQVVHEDVRQKKRKPEPEKSLPIPSQKDTSMDQTVIKKTKETTSESGQSMVEQALTFQLAKHLSVEVAKVSLSLLWLISDARLCLCFKQQSEHYCTQGGF
jgi:hypothetical protein